jgi:putative ABC transport system substrate-binding protein
LQEESRTVPIVFVTTIDPVGSGLIASLAHPGGNATGFTSTEFSMSAKLLELLKEIAPGVNRVAVLPRCPPALAALPPSRPRRHRLAWS